MSSLELQAGVSRSPHFFERLDWQPIGYKCHEFNDNDRMPVYRGDQIVMRYLGSFLPPPFSGIDVYSVDTRLEAGGPTYNVGSYIVNSLGNSVFYVEAWPSMPSGCYGITVRAGANPPLFQLTGVYVLADKCNTSVIEYRGCDTQLGYEYEYSYPGIPQYQRTRIWGRLERERIESDSDVFYGSTGLIQKVYARTRRIFNLNTRWMGHYQSVALSLAVQHDKFFISDEAYGVIALTSLEPAEFTFPPTPLNYPGSSKILTKMAETGWNKINTYCSAC